jgi:hypothetical protein
MPDTKVVFYPGPYSQGPHEVAVGLAWHNRISSGKDANPVSTLSVKSNMPVV